MKAVFLAIWLMVPAVCLADVPSSSPSTVSRDEFDRLVRLVEQQQETIEKISAQLNALRAPPTTQTTEEIGPFGIKVGMNIQDAIKMVPAKPIRESNVSGSNSWIRWEFNEANSSGAREFVIYHRNGKVTKWSQTGSPAN